MARVVKHEGKEPIEIKTSGESKWICRCGLSKNQPFCDGSHKLCDDEEEGKIYEYDKEGYRKEIK